jgi:hypothetical protein
LEILEKGKGILLEKYRKVMEKIKKFQQKKQKRIIAHSKWSRNARSKLKK